MVDVPHFGSVRGTVISVEERWPATYVECEVAAAEISLWRLVGTLKTVYGVLSSEFRIFGLIETPGEDLAIIHLWLKGGSPGWKKGDLVTGHWFWRQPIGEIEFAWINGVPPSTRFIFVSFVVRSDEREFWIVATHFETSRGLMPIHAIEPLADGDRRMDGFEDWIITCDLTECIELPQRGEPVIGHWIR